MKRFFYSFLCAAMLAASASAQDITVKLLDNKWDGGENAQGFAAITPDKEILPGDQLTVSFQGTTDAPDGMLSYIIVDTVSDDFGASQWLVVSNYGPAAEVKNGAFSDEVKITVASAVKKPVLCFFVASDFENFIDKELAVSVTCTAVTPKAPEAGDIEELDLNELAAIWDECGTYNYNKETKELTLCSWKAGAGWGSWFWSLTPGGALLESEEYASFTVEFAEPVPCQVGVVVQTDDGTPNGESNQEFADAGSMSATVVFEEKFIGTPAIKGMWIQFGEDQTIKLKRAYLTYKGEDTGIKMLSANVQINAGVVASEGEISVYDVTGKKIANANNEFNMNALPAGVYFIKTAEGAAKFSK